jgi:hypothetical protein
VQDTSRLVPISYQIVNMSTRHSYAIDGKEIEIEYIDNRESILSREILTLK